MPYQVRTEHRPVAGSLDSTVHVLEAGPARAEIWPAFGFNCYRWQVQRGGQALELLYADPQLFQNSTPTRSGIPILFPFPNRLRDGRLTWQGKEYKLPLNDSSKKNAIHGFACRRPWRIVEHGADADRAWLTGEFRGSVDAADVRELWPADYRIRITYTLWSERLRIEAWVQNPDSVPLPFGLGYHPYFHIPFVAGAKGEACSVEVPAAEFWELVESLPTGKRKPVDAPRDMRTPRPVGGLTLDDGLTGLAEIPEPGGDGLYLRGKIRDGSVPVELRLLTGQDFRELVAFTPAHRQALCLEPYTCITDAPNLQQQGIDAGLLVLQTGQTWTGVVEMRI